MTDARDSASRGVVRMDELERHIDRPLSYVEQGPIRDALLQSINLMDNTNRGLVAEVIVAHLIGAEVVGGGYGDWDLDFRGLRIEVKSSGDIQSWPQSTPSSISFSIEKTEGFILEDDGSYSRDRVKKRRSDAYIFCHHTGTRPDEPTEWQFYLAPTAVIDEVCGDQKQIGVSSLANVVGAVRALSTGLLPALEELLSLQT